MWVPPSHFLLQFRIFLWGFVAIATSKEWYEYVSNENSHRLGPFAWLSFYTSLIEVSGVVKFAGKEFDSPLPTWVYFMWGTIFAFWLAGFYRAFRNGQKCSKTAFDPYNPQVEIEKTKSH
jgi:hypothetical protein